MTSFIPFRMYNKIRNLGDSINPYIIQHVSKNNTAAIYSAKNKPHVLGIGSIFFDASLSSYIWGSGIINKKNNIPKIDPSKICALRGKKTAELLSQLGYRVPDVPLGDPGFFADEILKSPVRNVKKKYKVCVIPHHASIASDVFKKMGKLDDVVVLNMMTNDLSALEVISQSECVISQSLHGLVFAESLNIPNLWVSDRFDESWKFKFEDWFSTMLHPQNEPVPISNSLSEMMKMCKTHDSLISKSELSDVFPGDRLVENFNGKDIISHHSTNFFEVRYCELDLHEYLDDGFVKSSVRKNLERKLLDAFAVINNRYSYPFYTLIGSKSSNSKFIDECIHSILKIMDKKHTFVFATLVIGGQPPKGVRVYNVDGFKVTKNIAVGDCFLIRPNGRFSLDNDFLTFYI